MIPPAVEPIDEPRLERLRVAAEAFWKEAEEVTKDFAPEGHERLEAFNYASTALLNVAKLNHSQTASALGCMVGLAYATRAMTYGGAVAERFNYEFNAQVPVSVADILNRHGFLPEAPGGTA